MKLFIAVVITAWGCFAFTFSNAQISKSLVDEVKDSIIARYNRSDFEGVYRLADTSFTKSITKSQMVNFLSGNFSTGRIEKSTVLKDSLDGTHYLLEGQARNVVLVLQVSANKTFTNFGFRNSSPTILTTAPAANTNNPLHSALDIRIDSIAKEYFRFSKAASLSIGIIKKGKTCVYYYGETDHVTKRLPDGDTRYQIASVTKTFTATLLARAVLEGKVNLNDDIRKYLSGNYSNLEYGGIGITLQDLANHTSGLPVIPSDLEMQPDFDPVNAYKNYSREMFLSALSKIKLSYSPGSKFEYSNTGMSLVALIMERVYNAPFQVLLQKYVTGPLKMDDTKISLDTNDLKRLAIPYGNNGKILPVWDMGISAGAGGITSTMNDMLNYLRAQISEKNDAIKLTHQPTANSTGLGWGVRTINGVRNLQHNGGAPGSRSHVSFFPEIKTGCVILINNDSDNAFMNNLVFSVQKAINDPKL